MASYPYEKSEDHKAHNLPLLPPHIRHAVTGNQSRHLHHRHPTRPQIRQQHSGLRQNVPRGNQESGFKVGLNNYLQPLDTLVILFVSY